MRTMAMTTHKAALRAVSDSYQSRLIELYLSEEEEERIAWFKETLIPDLRDSGFNATADDFLLLIEYLEKRRGPEVQIQDDSVPSPGESAEAPAVRTSAGWRPPDADEDGKDEGSDRLRRVPGVEGPSRFHPSSVSSVSRQCMDEASEDTRAVLQSRMEDNKLREHLRPSED